MTHLRSCVLCLIMACVFLSPLSYANIGWTPLNEPINKSQRDTRQYQAIKLNNGMTVLLIEDVNAVKSLAALALPVGSLDNPVQQQGLAHYLEHMLLLGSKKYPEADNFSAYLAKHGGSYNASTAPYRTAYYLEVENSAFESAVDRLADAIAQPLLDHVNADRERNAVNAELTMARSRDGMRMVQVEAETVNPRHPASLFFGGNLETLSNKPNSLLQTELEAFYKRYYSANIMVGVLYSNRPLHELAGLASETFGLIKNNNATAPKITTPLLTAKEKGILIHYVPAQPVKRIQIEFPIVVYSQGFLSKNESYISYLIGNRSENTLSDALQKQGLINSIYAYSDHGRYRSQGIYSIGIDLTDKGLANRDQVVAAVFAYLKLIREQGLNVNYFNELGRSLDLAFRYQNTQRDMDYVESLADKMLTVPINHVIDSFYVLGDFDPKAVKERLDNMTIKNARIWYISPDEPNNKRAYFVDAPYQVEVISTELTAKWQKLATQMSLSLPKLNPYLADDFSIVNTPPKQPVVPKLLINGLGVRALYAPSYYFPQEPRLNINLVLRSPQALNSARQQVLFSLMEYLAGQELSQLKYQAHVSGIVFSSTSNHGIEFNANGFNQRLPRLFLELLNRYQHFTVSETQLEQAKSWYLQQLLIAENVKAYEQALQPIQQLSGIPYTERNTRRQLLATINTQDVTNYRDNLFRHASLDLLAVGNISAEQVKTLTRNIRKQINNRGTDWYRGEAIYIDKPKLANLEQQGSSTDSALAAAYIPINYGRIEGVAHSQVLAKILQSRFYNQLRTVEQLGYVVSGFPMMIGQQAGIVFLVQSNSHDPLGLYARYLNFYQQAEAALQALSDEDFAQYKQGVINQLNEPPQTYRDELALYRGDFLQGRFDFDSTAQLIEQIASLTKQDVLQFYRRAVLEQQGLSFISQVLGNSDSAKQYAEFETTQHYPNVSSLQKTLPRRRVN